MNDRELLESAAQAAGLQEWGWMANTLTHVVNNQFVSWEPLTDDGDALRLAVKLRIGVKYHRNAPPEVGLPRECAVAVTDSGKWFAEVDRDEGKATRRAIVRAAATLCE